MARGILTSWSGMEPEPLAFEGEVLIPDCQGSPRKSLLDLVIRGKPLSWSDIWAETRIKFGSKVLDHVSQEPPGQRKIAGGPEQLKLRQGKKVA